jgi:tryptophan synthase alpha chain
VTAVPPAPTEPGALETALRAARDAGRKLLVPYVTGGLGEWTEVIRAVADAGADACEIGIPFSDPVMDGPTIQAASEQALQGGANPPGILDAVRGVDAGIPLAVMTYYNIAFHMGHERFAASLAEAGVAAAILPDLPLEELGPWAHVADHQGIETVLLAAPTAPDDRLPAICARAKGFVYAVGLLGVTGERAELAQSAKEIATRLKAITDKPVLVGVGISTPQQAAEIAEVADGVVVGSALIRRLLDGAAPEEAGAFIAGFRRALD